MGPRNRHPAADQRISGSDSANKSHLRHNSGGAQVENPFSQRTHERIHTGSFFRDLPRGSDSFKDVARACSAARARDQASIKQITCLLMRIHES